MKPGFAVSASPIRRRASALLRAPAASRVRTRLDDALDSVRLRIDHAGLRAYQPIPGLNRDHARRTLGTQSRWDAMLPVLSAVRPRSAIDIGCNAGWFTLKLAELGISTIGIDNDPPMYRTAILSARRAPDLRVGILVMQVEPATTDLLPRADCVLLLSVWHHMVRDFGLAAADAILCDIWDRTTSVLFFETGETESVEAFRLPDMTPSPKVWLAEHLARTCPGAVVRDLGEHPAFGPDGEACRRTLFAVVRSTATREPASIDEGIGADSQDGDQRREVASSG